MKSIRKMNHPVPVTPSGEYSPNDAMIRNYEAAMARIEELEEENRQLKKKQVEIKAAKELYLKVFEDFPALLWRSGLDKMCDYFNRTWLEWTGKTMEEELGIGWAKGVHPDDYDECLKIYLDAFEKQEAFCMEYRLMDKYGKYRWIRDYGRPFHDLDDTFLGYIGSCYDITDNKVNEEMMIKLNATKDKMFRILAHDLRNPIATFVTLSEFLMENQGAFDEEEMAEIVSQMHTDSKNTMDLLENLLGWSLSQSDDITCNPKPHKTTDLFREVFSQVDLCAKAKKITIENDQKEVTINADKDMIITVLRNLVMNAIKFSHPDGVINLSAEQEDAGVLIVVTDHGVGMTPEESAELFSLKQTCVRRGTGNELGSGLGLVLCRDFVEKHQGRIWAESAPDKGTTIKLFIPLEHTEKSESESH